MRPEEADAGAVGVNVRWFVADELPELAFDHSLIVEYALWRLRNKVEYSRIAAAFLGESFTLAELRGVHEAVLQRRLTPRTSADRSKPPDGSSPPRSSAPEAATVLRACTGTTIRSSSPTTARSPRADLPDPQEIPMTTASDDLTLRDLNARGATGSSCSTSLLDAPWDVDASGPGYGPGASMADPIPAGSPSQGEIPQEYREASAEELDRRILAAKAELGDRVVVLGHFYQRDEVVRYADYVGDSFQLATAAKARTDAEAIIFCGVHFMAETADLLSGHEQSVILPNLAAGCSMADMADIDQVEEAWEQLMEVYGGESEDADGLLPIIPVTYMNSSAALKGFVGRHGGIVCTSSNATTVLEWAFARGRRVLFFPDQHLGRNTATDGHPAGSDADVEPAPTARRQRRQELHDAKVVLWHDSAPCTSDSPPPRSTRPAPSTRRARHRPPRMPDARCRRGRRVRLHRLHPPCDRGRGRAHDLRDRHRDQPGPAPRRRESAAHRLLPRSGGVPCSTMYRIHPGYLAWVLESLLAGEVVNRITVGPDVAEPARLALERMLAAKPGTVPAGAGRRA